MNPLDKLTEDLQEIGKITPKIAARVAVKLEAALKSSLEAGETPEGKAWAPRKKGGRAYAKAASAIKVGSAGDLVRATLSGPEVYGHFGKGESMPPRPMLPDAGAALPASVTDAIREATAEIMREEGWDV